MIYVIIRETIHPVSKERGFKAHPETFDNELDAAACAEQVARIHNRRAWACEFPTPPLLVVPTSAEIVQLTRKHNHDVGTFGENVELNRGS